MRKETMETSYNNGEAHLLTLNKFEIGLGCLIALGTILNGIASVAVFPYRVRSLETSQAELQRAGARDHDVLIRVDTNVKQIMSEMERSAKSQ